MAVMVGVIGGLLPLWIRGYNMVSTGDAEDDDEGVMSDAMRHADDVRGKIWQWDLAGKHVRSNSGKCVRSDTNSYANF